MKLLVLSSSVPCGINRNSRNSVLIPDIFKGTIKQVSSAHDWSQNKLRNVHRNFQTTQSFKLFILTAYNFLSWIECSYSCEESSTS